MLPQKELIDFANYLADLASDISKKYFRLLDNNLIDNKTDTSPVTKADIEIEQVIRREIAKKFPDHKIIGEEFINQESNSDYCWVIDPIDGTSSFMMGKPLFTNLIALTYKDDVIIGIINQPILNERWVGIKNAGCFFNGKKLSITKDLQSIEDAVLCTTSVNLFDKQDLEKANKVASLNKYKSYGGIFMGGDSYNYALVTLGFVDIVIETNLKPFDYMAIIPIIKEAGGVIFDWQGRELNIKSDGKVVVCGSDKIYQEIKNLLI